MQCCGWTGREDWSGNMVIVNSSGLLFPCSCQNVSATSGNFSDSGFCEAQTPDWPVYDVVSSAPLTWQYRGHFIAFTCYLCCRMSRFKS